MNISTIIIYHRWQWIMIFRTLPTTPILQEVRTIISAMQVFLPAPRSFCFYGTWDNQMLLRFGFTLCVGKKSKMFFALSTQQRFTFLVVVRFHVDRGIYTSRIGQETHTRRRWTRDERTNYIQSMLVTKVSRNEELMQVVDV